jgi:hypothetical protein
VAGSLPFADVLRAKLESGRESAPHGGQGWSARPLTPPLFGAGLGARRMPTSAYVWAEAPPAPRPPATLSPEARRALAALNDLGANLDDSLDTTDLRRAFCRLAHLYHPDRHPGSSRAEQERLSRLFAEMTDLSRLLASALETSTRH